jgi:hypothetical protein
MDETRKIHSEFEEQRSDTDTPDGEQSDHAATIMTESWEVGLLGESARVQSADRTDGVDGGERRGATRMRRARGGDTVEYNRLADDVPSNRCLLWRVLGGVRGVREADVQCCEARRGRDEGCATGEWVDRTGGGEGSIKVDGGTDLDPLHNLRPWMR